MKKTNASQLTNFKTISRIAERINNDDTDYISRLMSEAASRQTYFAGCIMKFTDNLEPEASEEILSLYLTVWGLYRQYNNCRDRAITQQQFERVQQRNISMFSYLDQEDDNGQFNEIVLNDHERLNHAAVMQFISHCFQSWPSLTKMELNDYCIQLIGIKSFVECFEEIAQS